MSAEALRQVIGRAVLDPTFRQMLYADPARALNAYSLTGPEVQALGSIPQPAFDAIAGQFSQKVREAALGGGSGDPAAAVDMFHKLGDLLIKGECATGEHLGSGDQAALVDYFHKGEGARGAAVDYFIKGESRGAAVDYFIKGESRGAAVDYFIKGEGGASYLKLADDLFIKLDGFGRLDPTGGAAMQDFHRPGGDRRRRSNSLTGILIGLLLPAILIGLLLFLPGETLGGFFDPLMGDGSVRPCGSQPIIGPFDDQDGSQPLIGENGSQPLIGENGLQDGGLAGILIGLLVEARLTLGSDAICTSAPPDFSSGGEEFSGPGGGVCGVVCTSDADCAEGFTCEIYQANDTRCWNPNLCGGGSPSTGSTCNLDGVCDAGEGANCADCQPTAVSGCGNGVCDPGEHVYNCSVDCGEPPAPQEPTQPPLDCTKTCGNGTCDAACGENPNMCPADCP